MKRKLLFLLPAFILLLTMIPAPSAAESSAWLALQQAVKRGGTVTLTKDVVCDNQEYGPIVVPEGVTVTVDLNGHTIDRNLTESIDFGAVFSVYGNLTVKDGSSGKTGTITGGKNTGSDNTMVAGGIQVNTGSLVLESGNITGCVSDQRGAGVNVGNGSFLMKGGSISGNRALSHGAGVSLSRGTFTMTGGIISGNYANTGAGVCASLADLFLSGGEISGNTARDNAGGLNTFGTSNVTLNGCRITGNTAPKAAGASFFLQDKSNYTFKVGKDTVIAGNTDADGNPSNLYLNSINSRTFVTIMDGSDAPDGMNIGISSKTSPAVSAPVQVSDATMQEAYRKLFFSDNDAYWLVVEDNILYLTADPPSHSVTYVSSSLVTISGVSGRPATSANVGDTVRFKVTPDSGYTLGAVSVKKSNGEYVTLFLTGGVYSFTMPDDDVTVTAGLSLDVPVAVTGLVYDGSEKTGVAYGEGYTLAGNTAVDAGSYTATATLNEGYIWKGGSAENKQISWNIDKATPTASLFLFTAPKDLICDGQQKAASVTVDASSDITGMGTVTVKYQKKLSDGEWSDSFTEAPKDIGTYKVLTDISEGENFTSTRDLTGNNWVFTIIPSPSYTITVTNDGHGTAGADPTSGTAGTAVKLIAAPAEGYEFDRWEVISGGVTVADDGFTIGSANVQIKACFKEIIPPTVVLTGISVTTAPDKTTYIEGESFDSAGMIVTATYSDDSSKAVTGYETSPSGSLSLADTAIEIRYTENGVTKTAELIIKVNPSQPVVYSIIIGMNQTILTDANSALFASDADFIKFDHVEVDGKTVAGEYYTAESGSTVITFNREFIQTLSTGEHKLTIVSSDGSASTGFTVVSIPTEAPVITPAAAYIKDGEKATFRVKTPDKSLIYQWYIDRQDGKGWTVLKGATGTSYTTSAVKQENDGYRYKCVAKRADGSSAESNIAVLHVGTGPVPPTGDNNHTLLWMTLVMSSGIALFCAGRKKRQYR